MLRALGIPISMYTVLFAVARTVGWIAQWKEMSEEASGRISRPRQAGAHMQDTRRAQCMSCPLVQHALPTALLHLPLRPRACSACPTPPAGRSGRCLLLQMYNGEMQRPFVKEECRPGAEAQQQKAADEREPLSLRSVSAKFSSHVQR